MDAWDCYVAALIKRNLSLVWWKLIRMLYNGYFVLFFLEYIYRYKVNEGVGIPKIPVHPIGYHDAEVLL